MRIKLIIFILSLFLLVKPVLAADPPTQISPTDDSTVSSLKLEWQAPAYPVCSNPNQSSYRVQVDDDLSFPSSSIDKNNYTRSTSYSPKLTFGTWYWRVMARDETCDNWSDWSPVWSFTLIDAPPSPTPTPLPSPTLKPTSSPTPTHTPSPTPTPKKSISQTVNPTSTPSPKNTSTPVISNDYSPTPETSDKISYQVASVAAETAIASQTAVEVKTQKQTNPIIWAGLIFIFAGISTLGYIYLKKNANIHIPFRR